jgi:MEMO1 family protein
MSLVGACVVPHPPVILPEVGGALRERVAGTVSAMEALAREVGELSPETLVVISPHAGLERGRMGVGVSPRYLGTMASFGAPRVGFELPGHTPLAESLLRECLARGLPVIPRGSSERTHELDHGALVPLYFLLEQLPAAPRMVLLTFSLLGADEHLEFGRAIGKVLDLAGDPALFVASGDLSHRLTPDAPAGFDLRGQEFDDAVREAFARADGDRLKALPQALVDAAGECGYRSLLVLFGALEGREYSTRVLSYEGPFGVGYLVGVADVAARPGQEAPSGPHPRGAA